MGQAIARLVGSCHGAQVEVLLGFPILQQACDQRITHFGKAAGGFVSQIESDRKVHELDSAVVYQVDGIFKLGKFGQHGDSLYSRRMDIGNWVLP